MRSRTQGEHNGEILGIDLGDSPERIRELEAPGVIASARRPE
jgi:hypothetical protein